MKNSSFWVLMLCYFIMAFTAFFFYPRWKQGPQETTISWDVSGYYLYLPATFIYNDLKNIEFFDSTLQKYRPTPDFQQAYKHEKSGNYVMKYSSGQAVTMLPWFFVGHLYALNSSKYPADGFSFPYQISIGIGMFLYALLGLWFLRKLLKHYFSDKLVSLILLLLVAGTNYLNYSSIDQALTHNTLFTLYTLVIWLSIGFYRAPNLLKAALIGLLCGLSTIIRPTDIIIVFIPLLWGLNNKKDIFDRIEFVKKQPFAVLTAILGFVAFASLQPIYWKYVSGDWLVYSYLDQGFSWLMPHLNQYLFSYRCGWLRFTPLMIMPFLGIYSIYYQKISRITVIFLMFLSLYIVSAWDVWDYGSSSGRAMVQYYPILIFPLAALFKDISGKFILKLIFYPITVLFVYLNIWWTFHAHYGSIAVIESTKQYYWRTVGHWTADAEDYKLLDNKYAFKGKIFNEKMLFKSSFDNDSISNFIDEKANKKFVLNAESQFSPAFTVKKEAKSHKWIRASALFQCHNKEWDMWKQAQFTIKFYDENKEVQHNMIRVFRFLKDGDTKRLHIDAKCPKNWTHFSVYIDNSGSNKTLFVDDLEIIGFDDKK